MYVATKGGASAIANAETLFRELNGTLTPELVQQIATHLPYLVDRVMSEGSLYAPELAALALAQSGGDLYEAVLLLRAYRSTQPRIAYAEPLDPARALTVRRISAAFKDIPGGQYLGPTLDYSHRLLRLDVLDNAPAQSPTVNPPPTTGPLTMPPLNAFHRAAGMLAPLPEETVEPAELPDVTRDPVLFPAPRAHRLQSLARADTGGVLTLGYASMRGYGLIHPTVNEVRLDLVDVELRHPISGEAFSIGRVRLCQGEVVQPNIGPTTQLQLGYTATLGWNEVKVIAGAMLDMEMDGAQPHPAHAEEFVLYHTEAVEASGFCIHYKLPHYVTFNSGLDAARKAQG